MCCTNHSIFSLPESEAYKTSGFKPATNMARLSLIVNLLIRSLGAAACADLAHQRYHPSTPKGLSNIPSGAVAKVRIIDSTLRIYGLPPTDLVSPHFPGFDALPTVPSWSFLVEGPNGKKALFDLGVPPNMTESFSPALVERIAPYHWDIHVEKHVVDILRDNGVDPKSINSIVWSHSHWDHIGDPSTFPKSTDLVVGPGFKEAMLPGYPTNPKALVKDNYFEGRNLVQVDFTEEPLTIGDFPALDFWGDGSFYLLNSPGHDIAHISALVRTTTSPDTFMFLGGDLCHHGAELRPSKDVSIPRDVQKRYECPDSARKGPHGSCPGAADFEALSVELGLDPNGPPLVPAIFVNYTEVIDSIHKAQEADADENVFVVWAHNTNINGTVDLFPKLANGWKKEGWREKVFWEYLADLAPGAANVSGNH